MRQGPALAGVGILPLEVRHLLPLRASCSFGFVWKLGDSHAEMTGRARDPWASPRMALCPFQPSLMRRGLGHTRSVTVRHPA